MIVIDQHCDGCDDALHYPNRRRIQKGQEVANRLIHVQKQSAWVAGWTPPAQSMAASMEHPFRTTLEPSKPVADPARLENRDPEDRLRRPIAIEQE